VTWIQFGQTLFVDFWAKQMAQRGIFKKWGCMRKEEGFLGRKEEDERRRKEEGIGKKERGMEYVELDGAEASSSQQQQLKDWRTIQPTNRPTGWQRRKKRMRRGRPAGGRPTPQPAASRCPTDEGKWGNGEEGHLFVGRMGGGELLVLTAVAVNLPPPPAKSLFLGV
jgi:hypothetical protein